jgi:hypothetical protein
MVNHESHSVSSDLLAGVRHRRDDASHAIIPDPSRLNQDRPRDSEIVRMFAPAPYRGYELIGLLIDSLPTTPVPLGTRSRPSSTK